MDLSEHDDPATKASDAPGTRALTKGSVALVGGILLGILAIALAAFGVLPALVLLVVAVPLGRWGSRKLQANEAQLPPESDGRPAASSALR